MIRGKLTAADLGSVVPVTSPPYTPGRRDYEGIDVDREEITSAAIDLQVRMS